MSGTDSGSIAKKGYEELLDVGKRRFLLALETYAGYRDSGAEIEEHKKELKGLYSLTDAAASGGSVCGSIRMLSEEIEKLKEASGSQYERHETYFRDSIADYCQAVDEFNKREDGVSEEDKDKFRRACGDLAFAMGVVKMDMEAYNDAKDLFGKAVDSYKLVKANRDITYYRRLGDAWYEQAAIEMNGCLYEKAVKSFKKARKSYKHIKEGKTADDYRRLGNTLFELGRVKAEMFLLGKESGCDSYKNGMKLEAKDTFEEAEWRTGVTSVLKEFCEGTMRDYKVDRGEMDRLFIKGDWKKEDPSDLFDRAIKEYKQIKGADKEKRNYVDVLRSWGEMHSIWGRIYRCKYLTVLGDKHSDEESGNTRTGCDYNDDIATLVGNALVHFKIAEEKLVKGKKLSGQLNVEGEDWLLLGATYYRLFLVYRLGGEDSFSRYCDEYKRKSLDVFANGGRSILRIFVAMSLDIGWAMVLLKGGNFFGGFLDGRDNEDGKFFNDMVGKGDVHRDVYKQLYIKSMFIISRLEVKSSYVREVAHYTRLPIAQQLLIKSAKFALFASRYFNDPEEGKVLLRYLFGKKWKGDAKKPEVWKGDDKGALDKERNEYVVFAGSFSFDCDSLNQFRLYGKDERREGTGVSLVLSKTFFREELQQDRATKLSNLEEKECGIINGREHTWWDLLKRRLESDCKETRRNTLFRCAYFDPETERVSTVGKKERFLFYRDAGIGNQVIAEKNHKEYKKVVDAIIEDMASELHGLKGIIEKNKNLDQDIVAHLTLRLRFLVKDIAYREEQECRIVKHERVGDGRIEGEEVYKKDDVIVDSGAAVGDMRMHLDYKPIVAKHVKKVVFGPKAEGIEMFRKCLVHEGLGKIGCERSKTHLA